MSESPTDPRSRSDDNTQGEPITVEMLDAVAAVGSVKHFIVVLALLRLEQRERERITGAAITREVIDIRDEYHSQQDIRRALDRLEEYGIVTVDRTAARRKGHDNRLTDWGEHLADAFEWNTIAQRIDPDAELPAESS